MFSLKELFVFMEAFVTKKRKENIMQMDIPKLTKLKPHASKYVVKVLIHCDHFGFFYATRKSL